MQKQNLEILIVVVLGTFVLVSLVAPFLPGMGTNNVMTGGTGIQQPTVYCSDSDGGIDLEMSGTCTDYNLNQEFTDYCETDVLIEYRCSIDGCTSLAYKCPYGCRNGMCSPQLLT